MAVESATSTLTAIPSGFNGLRLPADEFFALPDDGNRYELIDGVVVLSPSPTPKHQLVVLSILHPLVDQVARRGAIRQLPQRAHQAQLGAI